MAKIKIAIPVGDPAGIGPEIALKAALDPAVRAACEPLIVCDPALLERHAKACGIDADLANINILACPQPETASLGFGVVSPISGRASIAFCAAAVKAAMAGEVDAVVAAPQHETSIAQAGIKFDGHPSFVARQTGTDENGVYMMLCFGDTRIAHCTLHRSVREAIALITRENVARTIRATDVALKRLGIGQREDRGERSQPARRRRRIVRPEEIEIIKPAMDQVSSEGIYVAGPFGADTMFHMPGFDAFVVMLHDQGHIATKLHGAERRRGADHRHADPVCFGRARHRPRHRRQGHRQSGGDDRGGAATVEGEAARRKSPLHVMT